MRRNQSSSFSCRSQTATSSTSTGKSSSTNQRPKALAASRPIRPPPIIPTRIFALLMGLPFNEFSGLLCCRAIVHDGHQRSRHSGWIGVLDNVSAVNDSGGSLLYQLFSSLQDFLVGSFAATAHQHRDSPCNLNYFVVVRDVIGRICLNDVCAQFDCLPHQGQDLFQVPVHHVSARFLVGTWKRRSEEH